MSELKTHSGGCHCGAVRWEVDLPDAFEVEDCNCSICAMSGNIHIIVPSSRFRLLQGNDNLAEYTFNTGAARHLFCKTCGVKSFYIPRSNPDGVAVTWRCIDDWQDLNATVNRFDGQNWEQHAHTLAHKSKA
ncbi:MULTISPECIES: GFA family protein [Hyphomonas]|nr:MULTISPECIES: GFA family protein [Hyphomonas]MBB40125.1 aldehyde-activating protein [Hyphomonas sp.]|tara:strand:+ start:144 stop:539 length:396 start_codon:yes stop_codon:yes gene_type:complete